MHWPASGRPAVDRAPASQPVGFYDQRMGQSNEGKHTGPGHGHSFVDHSLVNPSSPLIRLSPICWSKTSAARGFGDMDKRITGITAPSSPSWPLSFVRPPFVVRKTSIAKSFHV